MGLDVSESEINTLIENRISNPKLTLLFVGVRWEEKGGPFAVEVIDELQNIGINSELIIAGCNPEISADKTYIKKVGFFDKSKKEKKDAFIDLYKKAHFFIMPTKAECVGMSFIESGSVGLPAIGTEVGGVPEAIIDSKTGLIIKQKQTAKDVAKWIISKFSDFEQYEVLTRNSYATYQKKLNWTSWSNSVYEIVLNEFI